MVVSAGESKHHALALSRARGRAYGSTQRDPQAAETKWILREFVTSTKTFSVYNIVRALISHFNSTSHFCRDTNERNDYLTNQGCMTYSPHVSAIVWVLANDCHSVQMPDLCRKFLKCAGRHTRSSPLYRLVYSGVGIGLNELEVRWRNVWNFAHGLKFKADFNSKMSVRRHELGGGLLNPQPTPAITTLGYSANRHFVGCFTLSPQKLWKRRWTIVIPGVAEWNNRLLSCSDRHPDVKPWSLNVAR